MAEGKKKIVVLDGGTGTSLINMGHEELKTDPLWSALYISERPEVIVDLHSEFFKSGADVVVAATYQASIEGFVKRLGVTQEKASDLVTEGVKLARKARDRAAKETVGRGLCVAGSVGPYGATLHDFSEYHGNYADKMTMQELMTWHTERLAALVKGQPDVLAVETIPVVKEAEAILHSLKAFPDMPAWVTFQCKDDAHTGHGEMLSEAARTVLQYDNVVAVGINCTLMQHVTPLLQSLSHLDINIPIIVKPNGGGVNGWPLAGVHLTDHAREWIQHGASWLGGCCSFTPSDIANLRRFLEQQSDLELPGLKLDKMR